MHRLLGAFHVLETNDTEDLLLVVAQGDRDSDAAGGEDEQAITAMSTLFGNMSSKYRSESDDDVDIDSAGGNSLNSFNFNEDIDSEFSDDEDENEEPNVGNVITNISLALSLLHGTAVCDPKCRAFAVVRLLQGISDAQLLGCLLPLAQAVTHEKHLDTALVRFLLRRALQSVHRIGMPLYWHFKVEMDRLACERHNSLSHSTHADDASMADTAANSSTNFAIDSAKTSLLDHVTLTHRRYVNMWGVYVGVQGLCCMFRAMAVRRFLCSYVLLLSCSITTGALDIPNLLPS